MIHNPSLLGRKKRREISRTALLFSLPALFFICVFILYPIINSFWISLHDWKGIEPAMKWAGLKNWQTLINDKYFFAALQNNLKIVALSLLIQLPVAMALAALLDAGGRKLNALKVSWFLPYLMSSVAIGYLFRYSFDPIYGIITPISELFGGGMVDMLGHPQRAFYAVIGVVCWQFIPFYMVYFLAGLTGIPVELYEASIIDGAKRRQYFFRVVFPLMFPTIRNASIISLVGSLKYFDLIFVMTEGGPYRSTELMATYMYKNTFASMKMSYGSTIAMGMFLIITTVSVLTLTILMRRENT